MRFCWLIPPFDEKIMHARMLSFFTSYFNTPSHACTANYKTFSPEFSREFLNKYEIHVVYWAAHVRDFFFALHRQQIIMIRLFYTRSETSRNFKINQVIKYSCQDRHLSLQFRPAALIDFPNLHNKLSQNVKTYNNYRTFCVWVH